MAQVLFCHFKASGLQKVFSSCCAVEDIFCRVNFYKDYEERCDVPIVGRKKTIFCWAANIALWVGVFSSKTQNQLACLPMQITQSGYCWNCFLSEIFDLRDKISLIVLKVTAFLWQIFFFRSFRSSACYQAPPFFLSIGNWKSKSFGEHFFQCAKSPFFSYWTVDYLILAEQSNNFQICI